MPISDVISQSVFLFDTIGSHTFQVPFGVEFVFIDGSGGGGGGGGGNSVNRQGGGGGSSAVFIRGYMFRTRPGEVLDVEIGAGGAGGAVNGNGSNGEYTEIHGELDYLFLSGGTGGFAGVGAARGEGGTISLIGAINTTNGVSQTAFSQGRWNGLMAASGGGDGEVVPLNGYRGGHGGANVYSTAPSDNYGLGNATNGGGGGGGYTAHPVDALGVDTLQGFGGFGGSAGSFGLSSTNAYGGGGGGASGASYGGIGFKGYVRIILP